jgi:hypothetical protein
MSYLMLQESVCKGLSPKKPKQPYLVRTRAIPVFVVITLSATSILAQDSHQASSDTVNVAGTWHLSLRAPHGDSQATLRLQQDGSKLSGVFKGERRTLSLNGKIVGNRISFSLKTFMMSFTFDGTVEGDTMHGTTSQQGSWSATRENGGASGYTPFAPSEKHHLSFDDTFSMRFAVMAAAMAGIQQAQNSPSQWGQGAEGYADRFASLWGQKYLYSSLMFGTTTLFGEDPRRLYSEKHGFVPRFADAVRLSWMARRDDGRVGFAYSRTLSITTARLIAYTWYPDGYSSPEKPLQQVGLSLAINCAFGVAYEFAPDLKKRLARAMSGGHDAISESP